MTICNYRDPMYERCPHGVCSQYNLGTSIREQWFLLPGTLWGHHGQRVYEKDRHTERCHDMPDNSNQVSVPWQLLPESLLHPSHVLTFPS